MDVNGVKIEAGQDWQTIGGSRVKILKKDSSLDREFWLVQVLLCGEESRHTVDQVYSVFSDGRIDPLRISTHDLDGLFVGRTLLTRRSIGKPEFEEPGYGLLRDVLSRAFDQAARGKGKERHANDKPFEEQPMATINREQGSIDGFLYQARKKALEARGLPDGRAQAELLGAINYLAGAVIALDTWAKKEVKP